jgi:segregation and condensation protein B
MSEDTQNSTQSNPATKQIIEGLLMAAGKPLPMSKIAEVFTDSERPDPEELKAALKEIEHDCETRGFELKQVASGYRFQVKQQFSEWVGKLWEEKPQRYSRALLETISIIAYRQPVTRGEIEKIRGVVVSTNIIRTLMEREWVRVVGHRDVPGRPAMYATTREFLDYFNLRSLEELPPLADVKELEDLEPELSLDDDAPESRVLEFPTAEDMEAEFDILDEEEERAAAIGTRPIEEILGIQEQEPEEDWDDDDFDNKVNNDVDDAVHAAPSENEDEVAIEDNAFEDDVNNDEYDAYISDDMKTDELDEDDQENPSA